MATRTAAGLFDVSHMGEIEVFGDDALDLVQHVTCNDASKLVIGQAQYSGLMTAQGTFVDDLLVHKISDQHYFLCVNAGNQDQDFEHIRGAQSHRRRRLKMPARGTRSWPFKGRRRWAFCSASPACRSNRLAYYHFTVRRRGRRRLHDRATGLHGRRRI